MQQQLTEGFKKVFETDGDNLRLFFAPGRVNLIGEHIDYNGGLVLPCALDKGTYVAINQRDDDVIRLASSTFNPIVSISKNNLAFDPDHGWANYPKGVASCLIELGHKLTGFDMYIIGDLPNGAGLSSSASISMAVAVTLNNVFGLGISSIEMARLCQKAEFYNGVNCGIMDPFASAMGKKDHAILLDCNTLEYSHVPLTLGDYRIVIANTNKRRGLADSQYNERRRECEEALKDLKKVRDINALCDLSLEEFEKHKHIISDKVSCRRAEHAVYENHRTKKAAEYLTAGKWNELADTMIKSHESLRDLYEVSCNELDSLVRHAYAHGKIPGNPPIYGGRMTGAGFGGCTVNIVHKDYTDSFAEYVGGQYERDTNKKASFYVASPGDGAKEI